MLLTLSDKIKKTTAISNNNKVRVNKRNTSLAYGAPNQKYYFYKKIIVYKKIFSKRKKICFENKRKESIVFFRMKELLSKTFFFK